MVVGSHLDGRSRVAIWMVGAELPSGWMVGVGSHLDGRSRVAIWMVGVGSHLDGRSRVAFVCCVGGCLSVGRRESSCIQMVGVSIVDRTTELITLAFYHVSRIASHQTISDHSITCCSASSPKPSIYLLLWQQDIFLLFFNLARG